MRLILLSLLATAFLYGADPLPPSLTVMGKVSLQKPADQISLTVGVVTEGNNAEEALAENNNRMQTIIDKLQTIGLTSSDYKTGRFSISPRYTQSPQNPPPYWKPTIYGYEVSNTIQIKTLELKQAGQIIDLVTKAGANQVQDIQFGLKDPRIYSTEVINKATALAMDDARALARAANVNLSNILSIKLDQFDAIEPIIRASSAKGFTASSVPIEPGEVEVGGTVTITWEIKPN